MKNQNAIILIAFVAATAVGCGNGKSIVEDVKLRTYKENGDGYAELEALIETGELEIPAIELPVVNPDDVGRPYGKLTLRPTFGTQTEVALAVNLNNVLDWPLVDPVLPNQSQVPIGGVDEESILAYPIKNTNSRAYIVFEDGQAILGAAVVIKPFDKVGDEIGRVNVFPRFQSEDGVIKGIAGIFTSDRPDESGLALWVDLLPIIDELRENIGQMQLAHAQNRRAAFTHERLGFFKGLHLMNALSDLNRTKAVFEIR